MKKRFLMSIFVFYIFLAMGCETPDSSDDENNTKVDYTSYTDYSILVENQTNKKLVAFKNSLSDANLIGGIPASASNHGLKKESLFTSTGDFSLIVIKEEDYLANIDNLNSLSGRPFSRVYAFYNAIGDNNVVYSISSNLGGTKRIISQLSHTFHCSLKGENLSPEIKSSIS